MGMVKCPECGTSGRVGFLGLRRCPVCFGHGAVFESSKDAELTRLRDELAATREAVRVLGEEVRAWRAFFGSAGSTRQEAAAKAVNSNPIAAAAVKEKA